MTPEQRSILMQLAGEYGVSLAVVDDEKIRQKAICAHAQAALGTEPAHFAKLATALHRDTAAKERKALDVQGDLFALALGENP
jgi:hypothetical protein